jgi:membrane fusion protein (multidrug efflux system)
MVAARALLAEVETGQAELEIINQKLSDATVRTPVRSDAAPDEQSYAIAERNVSIGEYVREGTPLFRLVDDDPIKFRAPVPERHSAQLAVGQTVLIQVDAFPSRDFEGKVVRINPRVDPTNRTFQIEVLVPNTDRALKPGGFAKGWVRTRTDEGIVFVPKQAVQTFAGVSKVFVAADGKAKEILIDIDRGIERDAMVEARGKLSGDERLIVTGLNRIAAGVPVIVE